ncbi:hypothetical protein [Micromonospora sp. CPCC 205561]|uniref:hypothetical protein n=1 Tax=Micromonospora sp. CPCC 205561 TaxID=3122407 RepID=UPI002FEEBF83
MARRGWGGSIATAVGIAAGAGAAQLGFGYGLGIINWAPADATAGATAWVAGLIWATWIAATSTVCGAVCAQRLRERAPAPDAEATGSAPPGGVVASVALAVAAGVGALVTVLLVAVPARAAVAVPDTGSPRDVAAAYAAVGVLVGVLTAVWALRSRAAASNVLATVGWLWLLAVVAVVDGVLAGRGLTSAQLGIWQLGPDDGRYWIRDYFYWPGALLSLGSALVIGVLAARRDARHADHRVGAAVSGAAGPLLVAVAYFLAVPRLTAISPEQVSAHLIAPYAVIVGVGGAVAVATLVQRAARRTAPHPAVVVPRQRTGEPADHPADPAHRPDDLPTGGTGADGTPTAPGGTPTDRASTTGTGLDATATGGPASPEPAVDREAVPVPAVGHAPATASTTVVTAGAPAGAPPAPSVGDGGSPSDEPSADDPTGASTSGRRPRSGRRTR